MVERIRSLMVAKGLSSTQFADEIEIPRAIMSHLLSGRNKPSLDVMLKIVQAFPEVSINWLLLGEGEMLTKLAKNPISAQPQATAATKVAETKPAEVNPAPAKKEAIPVAAILPPSGKVVEQIVVFYTDKTFSIYTSGDQ